MHTASFSTAQSAAPKCANVNKVILLGVVGDPDQAPCSEKQIPKHQVHTDKSATLLF